MQNMDSAARDRFVQFFGSFKGFSYDPENSPELVFQRLCSQRGWGSVKLQRYTKQFEEILQLAKSGGQQPASTDPTNTTNDSSSAPSHQQLAESSDISSFFQKYEYQRFKFNPSVDVQQEFERLCQVRQWGAKKVKSAQDELQQTLKRVQEASMEPTATVSTTATTSTRSSAIRQFFKKYEFHGFQLNSKAPSNTEFDRLCTARKWGTTRLADVGNEFQQALKIEQEQLVAKSAHSKNIEKFFKKYEFPEFKWNRQAPPNAEFDRLCVARKWGKKKIADAQEEFQHVLLTTQNNPGTGTPQATNAQAKKRKRKARQNDNTTSTTPASAPTPTASRPIVQFFTQFNSPQYKYMGHEPVRELDLLIKKLHKPNWEKLPFNERLVDCIDEKGHQKPAKYHNSNTAKELKRRFYRAVEKQFEEGIRLRAQMAGMKSYEYVVELLELGKAPMDRHDAHMILHRVNVNIYDFLDYEEALRQMEEAIHTAKKSATTVQKPPKPSLYPSEQVLGVYCKVTGRIYPLDIAARDGNLRLLLKHVGKYFRPDAMGKVLDIAQELMPGAATGSKKGRHKQGHGNNHQALFKVVTKIEKYLGLDPEPQTEDEDSDSEESTFRDPAFIYFYMSAPIEKRTKWEHLFEYAREQYQESHS